MRKKSTALHLSIIQFSPKSITKYLNFLLTIYVYWHSSENTFWTQCLSSNIKSSVDGFIYRHVSCNINLTTFTSRIFTIFITRSWTDNDEDAIDCTNHSISARLSMKACHISRDNYVVTLVVANCNFHKRHRSHDDSDIQVFISCTSKSKFSSQYTRCMTRFITRRCSAGKSNIHIRYTSLFKKSVQKVSRILCFFKNYLFIHEFLLCPLQSNPHQILYTCANVFSNPRSTSNNYFLWSCSAPPSMPSLSPQS